MTRPSFSLRKFRLWHIPAPLKFTGQIPIRGVLNSGKCSARHVRPAGAGYGYANGQTPLVTRTTSRVR